MYTRYNEGMKKRDGILVACQTPRIDIYEPGNTEKAELLFELLDEYGTQLHEWQRLVLRRWLAEDKDGNFVNTTCGLSVPRQNGKTEIIVARVIYGIIFRKATGLFTAQAQSTVDVVIRRVQEFFYESPYEEIFNLLTPRFQQKPKNFDFIEFQNGARYRFMTRTRLGGLGSTNDEVINDEAADMYDSHEESLRPTVSAAKSKNPQFIFCGTPPMAESLGTVFPRARKKICQEGEKGCWTEWSVDTLTDPHDREAWFATNPSLGKNLLVPAVEDESASLSLDGFNRMRLGWWAGVETKRAIKQKDWDDCFSETPDFDDGFAPTYAVKFSPDRTTFSICVAQPLKDGRIHTEIVMHRPMSDGFHRIVNWFTSKPPGQNIPRWKQCGKIILDGVAGQAILFEDLVSMGVPKKKILQPNLREISAAHEFIFNAIKEKKLSHFRQPALDQSVRVAKIRPIGRNGGFGWESMNKEMTTSALDSATFAYWGAKVHPKKKRSLIEKKEGADKWQSALSSL